MNSGSRTRETIIRRTLKISPLSEDEYWVGVARTKDEFEAAFSLLHDCYVEQGIMESRPSRLRCNIFQVLPDSATFIVRHRERVVGTLALIRDSSLGLPSDESYKVENDLFRREGGVIGEASALAVDREYRGRSLQIGLSLMKYLLLYALRILNLSVLVAVVHPRSKDFYVGLWNFRQNGPIVEYGFAKGALATHLTMDTRGIEAWMKETYRGMSDRSNLYRYLFEFEEPVLHFPSGLATPLMTATLLRYFFVERTRVLREASPEQLAALRDIYSRFFDHAGIAVFDAVSEAEELH